MLSYNMLFLKLCLKLSSTSSTRHQQNHHGFTLNLQAESYVFLQVFHDEGVCMMHKMTVQNKN